jgi:hypothetical protein
MTEVRKQLSSMPTLSVRPLSEPPPAKGKKKGSGEHKAVFEKFRENIAKLEETADSVDAIRRQVRECVPEDEQDDVFDARVTGLFPDYVEPTSNDGR